MVRDKNGCYKLDIPVLPPALIGENGEELGDLDGEESGESTLDAELSGRDKESMFGLPALEEIFGLMLLFCRVRGCAG